MVGSGSGSGSSSDDINIGPSSSARAKGIKDIPANLKRKRGTEKTSSPQVRPVVLIRQVVPGMLGPKYAPVTPPPPPASSTGNLVPIQVEVSPVKKPQRPITMRRVVDKPPEKNAVRDRVEEADAPDVVYEEMGETNK